MPNVDVFTTGAAPVNTLLSDSSVTSAGGVSRTLARFQILIEGEDLADSGIAILVKKIKIKEFLNTTSSVTIELLNIDDKLADSYLFKEGNEINIKLGWDGIDLVDHGSFIIDEPIFKYPSAPENPTIIVVGHNKARLLSKDGMKRRKFEQKKDSDIAYILASEYGLKTDIKTTTVTYPIIIQANENDLEFLLRRAELYGFVVYVLDDTLHFHPIKFVDTGKKILLNGTSSAESSVPIVYARFSTETFLQALKVKKEQVDWQTLGILKSEDKDEQDALSQAAGSQYKKASQIVPKQAIWYLIDYGHLQDNSELDSQVEAVSKSSRWICKVECKTVGLEFVNIGKVIRIESGLKYDGPFLISECEHLYDVTPKGSTYTTKFNLIRSFSKDSLESFTLNSSSSAKIDVTGNLIYVPANGFIGTKF